MQQSPKDSQKLTTNQNCGQAEDLCCKSKLRLAKACCGVYEKQDVRSILINFWNMNYVTFHYLLKTWMAESEVHDSGWCVSCSTLPPTTFPTCTIIELIYSMEYNLVVTMLHCMIACNIMRVSFIMGCAQWGDIMTNIWYNFITTLSASKKPPLMPISLPT